MDEIDYSKFLYKKNVVIEKPKKRKKPTSPRYKKFLYASVVILLCFSILFLTVDFFGKGILSDSLISIFSQSNYSYYLVVEECKNKDMAYACSISSKNGGGAGYIFNDDNIFYVAYAAYLTKTDASNVVSKNTNANMSVYTISFKSNDTDFCNLVYDFCSDTIECCNSLDDGVISEGELNKYLSAYKTRFAIIDNFDEKYLNVATFTINTIEEIDAGITQRNDLVFQLRHALISILFSVKEASN